MSNLDPALVKIHEALEEYTKSGVLDKVGNAPPDVAKQADGPQPGDRVIMSRSDTMSLRQEMLKKSTPELLAMFADQAQRPNTGIPVGQWLGAQNESYFAALQGRPQGEMILKAADTSSASALIRQDLEPMLYALFVKEFPGWARLNKIPANGLVHAWNQITSYGGATFMSELGTVTDDQNTYSRQTTNVSVLARRVGVSFKSQFAVQQGGAGYNLETEELTGGLLAMANQLQKTIFQGNATASGGTATSEYGAYDANAFTGMRSIYDTASAVDANVTGATPASITEAIDDAVVPITNNGGRPSVAFIRYDEMNIWNKQQLEFVRILPQNQVEFVPGVTVSAVQTSAGPIPLVPIPGTALNGIGHYTNPDNAKDSADIYVVDERSISLPFLGSDSIQVLDIPVGVGGQLVHYYILWVMVGLQVRSALHGNKARIQIEA